MTEKTKSRNLYQRLLEAAKAVGVVVKEQPKGMKYSVVSHDSVNDTCRDALLDNGVMVFPSVVTTIESENSTKYMVEVDTTFVNTDNPEDRITVRTIGRGKDEQGGGGTSYACKYALLKVLMLKTGTDADFQEEQRERQDVEKFERDILVNRLSDRRQELELSSDQVRAILKKKGHGPKVADLSILILRHFVEWFEAAGADEVNGLLGQTESGPDTKVAMRLYNELEMKPQDMIATFGLADIDFNANNDVETNLAMLSDTQYDRVVVLLKEAKGLEPAEVSG